MVWSGVERSGVVGGERAFVLIVYLCAHVCVRALLIGHVAECLFACLRTTACAKVAVYNDGSCALLVLESKQARVAKEFGGYPCRLRHARADQHDRPHAMLKCVLQVRTEETSVLSTLNRDVKRRCVTMTGSSFIPFFFLHVKSSACIAYRCELQIFGKLLDTLDAADLHLLKRCKRLARRPPLMIVAGSTSLDITNTPLM